MALSPFVFLINPDTGNIDSGGEICGPGCLEDTVLATGRVTVSQKKDTMMFSIVGPSSHRTYIHSRKISNPTQEPTSGFKRTLNGVEYTNMIRMEAVTNTVSKDDMSVMICIADMLFYMRRNNFETFSESGKLFAISMDEEVGQPQTWQFDLKAALKDSSATSAHIDVIDGFSDGVNLYIVYHEKNDSGSYIITNIAVLSLSALMSLGASTFPTVSADKIKTRALKGIHCLTKINHPLATFAANQQIRIHPMAFDGAAVYFPHSDYTVSSNTTFSGWVSRLPLLPRR